jgi:hypothetical protein
MGYLYYGTTDRPVEIPDWVLAHVKVVATTKLRRLESFTLSWQHPEGTPRGRSTLWMHPSIPLRFEFDTADTATLDRDYLQKLALAAGSTNGMVIDVWATPDSSVSAERVEHSRPDLVAAG